MNGSDGPAGAGLLAQLSWAGTAVLAVAAAAAVAWAPLRGVAVVVSIVLFIAGCVVFLWALAVAANRSRTEAIGIGGLFFLQGSAPRPVARSFMASLIVQVVVAVAAAAARPYTSVAFAVLAPTYGLAMAGLWGARHGRFAPR